MPKRKNNKNKRKNKNRSDVKNVSDDKGSDKCETCSSDSSHVINNEQIIVNDTKNQFVNACMAEVNVENTVLKIPEPVLESSSSSLDQDLNNNSNDVQMLNQPVLNETNKEMQDKLCDIDNPNLNIYVVESPEQSLKSKSKLSSSIKSKSLDDDDEPKIVEITDEVISQSEEDNISSIVNTTNVIISDAESDMEWQKTDDLENQNTKNEVTGKLSITTIPLNVAQCELTKSLTPEEEVSLRNYLHTLNLSKHPSNFDSIEINAEIEHIVNREICHRLRKKGLAEDFLAQRLCPPRILDVIDEESGESSLTSRRHSYLSDKKSDIDELEDDVFEEKIKKVPKIGRDINIKPKNIYKNTGRLVPQQCILVDAKIKEPEISEARGNWTTRTVEKMSGAEIIYLTDSSSSTSSLHDLGGDETDDGAETDLSVRMITPTIEVTDTENLLKKTFVSNSDYNKTKDSESMSSKSDPQLENLKTIIDSGDNATHEVIVLSTDNIKTDLYVKELDAKEISEANDHTRTDIELSTNKMVLNENTLHKTSDQYDLEIKVLKCELNNAMNNLIKEYSSDSEIAVEDNMKELFTRQDSSSSIGSSQCTAKYNPTYSSLNDVSNIIYDEAQEINQTKTISSIPTDSTKSHVIDVFKHIAEDTAHNKKQYSKNSKQPSKLRDLCVLKIAAFPYGEKILQELAHVSKRLQNINVFSSKSTDVLEKSKTDLIEETNNKRKPVEEKSLNHVSEISSLQKNKPLPQQKKDIAPPVQPRKSSFKKSHVDHPQTAVHNDMKSNPTYLCQSPSQKMLMDKTNSVISEINDISNTTKNKSLEITKCNEFYAIKKANDEDINPSAVPFKSQTGSRLLALLRDPSVSNNLKNSTLIVNNKSFDNRNRNFTETSASNKYGQIISGERITSAKPIPPPRPKKYSAFYESDESSEFTDNSLRSIKSEKKIFHYSTGNLNKEIENDVSSIQNMHRYYTNVRDELNAFPRRPSLPKDLCDQQMEYIKKKEKEVEAEIHRLEGQKINASFTHKIGPKAPLISKKEFVSEMFGDADDNYYISHKKDASYSASASRLPEKGKLSSLFSSSQEEIFRNKMYSEYVSQMAERQERKQQKIIKITNNPTVKDKFFSKSMNELDSLDIKLNNRIEKEFISKARERWNKLGIKDPETEDEREDKQNVYCEPTKKVIEHKIKVFESGEERDVKKLPNHLQEFVRFATKDKKKESGSPAVWRPGAPTPPPAPAPLLSAARSPGAPPPPPPPPVWIPSSAGTSPQSPRKTFRPVHFEETPPARRKFSNSEQNGCTSGSESESRLRTSQSAPATGLSTLGANSSSRLPKAQNPTITLLQKAREGQIARGANYLQLDAARLPRDRASPPKGDPVHALRREYASESEAERSDYERGAPRKMADAQKKVEGIGPTTKEGMPVALRSEVKDPSRWYKKMYDTIHKNKYDDDYVTIRYKSRRGQPPVRVTNKSQYAYFDPRSGYLSEPEGGLSRISSGAWSDAYDSDVTTGPRRRTASVQEDKRNDDVTSPYLPNNKYSTLASARASQEIYKNQPGRIEDYVPGRSSVVDKEAKQQISSTTSLPQASPKDKKDLTSTILSRSNMARALKESGYESDSTLVFRRREEADGPLSPAERRAAYKDLQAGGEPPLRGFRSPAPPRQESPRRYVESDVNIHYRCPVRHDPLPLVPERELARQQAEHMKRLYREQKRNKYLQELQDLQNRRHQDNFTPSQKAIVPLNRYDEAERVVARALYAFNGQTSRELSFRKGDLIHVRRQIDANWYEGELQGRIGLFPYNYIEILKGNVVPSQKKASVIEGRARAKFDFTAQTNLELPLKKGEVVVLTRRIDHNWWEGRNGNKTGIFPDSYVTVLQEPSQSKPEPTDKPVASPAAHGLLNGSAKQSMGAHNYMPQFNSPSLSNAPPSTQPLPGYVAKPAQATLSASERGYGPPSGPGVDLNNTEPLYVDTNAEAVPYRAMYKYRPQNPDELELNEGDTVYVLEKCDDGWYVGSSQRTGRFGTFPGNYVQRI